MIKEISIVKLLKALLAKLWLVVALSLLCGSGAYYYAAVEQTPMYTSKAMLYINNNSNGNTSGRLDSANMMASQAALQLYLVVLKSESVLNSALDKINLYKDKASAGEIGYEEYKFLLDYEFTTGSVAGMVSAIQENETEILTIKANASDPRVARFIAATITEVLQYEVPQKIGATSNKLLQEATYPKGPSSPNVKQTTLIGLLAGAVVACGIILALLVFDTVVRSEEDLEENFPGVPVLGVIPNIDTAKKLSTRSKKKKE